MSSRGFQTRCFVLCLLFTAGLSGLSLRLLNLQVWEREKYAQKSRAAYTWEERLLPLRGTIVDRNDEVLAKSIPYSSLMVDWGLMRDPEVTATALAYESVQAEPEWARMEGKKRTSRLRALRNKLMEEEDAKILSQRYLARAAGLLARPLEMSREELRQEIEKRVRQNQKYFAIAKDLNEDKVEILRGLIEENRLTGFGFESSMKRWHPTPGLASHVIGFTGESQVKDGNGEVVGHIQEGKFGVEAAMEDELKGSEGHRIHSFYAMPDRSDEIRPPQHGWNIQLTIDLGVQEIVEEELDAGLAEYQSQRGCIIVLEPHTGELLAMVSRPSFDLNTKEGLNKKNAAMNYALQAIYEPGSTFKIVATSGALNERLVSPTTPVSCHNGRYQEGKLVVPDHHPYASLSVAGVLQKSSNIGAFMLGRQLGTKRFYDYAGRYGFGQKTQILLSGESAGIVRDTENLSDFSRATYGYAVNVTPLQVAMAYGALANGGKLMRPHVVKSIIGRDGTSLKNFEPEVVREVVSSKTAAQMREALAMVTAKGGTATQAAVAGFKVAGKTGTALRVDKKKYMAGRYTVSFVGMLPAKDPRFVCLVVIDDPLTNKVSRYGGTIAGPVFAKTAKRLAEHLHIPPTEPLPKEKHITSSWQP